MSDIQEDRKSISKTIALTAICAALYAAASAATSPIPTPWGVGHFRPGVIVPALFALISTPLVAGTGAAIGTFLASFILAQFGLSNPALSLMSGVPGNFVGFYLLGWLLSKGKTWRSFVSSSIVALFVGNFIAATGVMVYFSSVVPRWAAWAIGDKILTILGFTLFWMVTMVPFVVALVPPLYRGIAPIISGRFAMTVRPEAFGNDRPRDLLYNSVMIFLLFVAIYVGVVMTPFGDAIFSKVIRPEYVFWVKNLFIIAGGSVLAFGLTASFLMSRKLSPAGIGRRV
ncbi:MAG: ECF transporter S component [Nitrososphaerota archaeon]|nr:ECF transporter S component [Aigarchaeota archaeon]MDW8076097.1 ECF transporter S component [Nitrososphaerota archaeon]